MKAHLKFIQMVLLLISLLAVAKIGKSVKAEARYQIKAEAKAEECPKNPIFGMLKLNLVSPLNIGSETDDRYFFSSLREIRADKNGNIYALDTKASRIQIYDINGKYIRTIGGKGQGPGEFFVPSSFFIDEEGNSFVHDTMTRKITEFSKDWNFKESFPLNEIAYGKFFVNKKGEVFFNSVGFELDGNMNIDFIKFDPKENIKKKIISSLFLKPIAYQEGRLIYEHPYLQNIYFALLSNENIVLVKSLEPVIYYLSKEGDIVREVIKKEKSEIITRKEKEIVFSEILKQMGKDTHEKIYFPEHRPIYSNLLADDRNRIYLEKFNPLGERNSIYSYYVFSEKGGYLYNLASNIRIEYIGRGHIFTIKIDEESGKIKLIRYKIENWGQLKE